MRLRRRDARGARGRRRGRGGASVSALTRRKNSSTKVFLVSMAPLPPPPPEIRVGSSARQLRPTLKNRWGDHAPVRRVAPRAIACEWCNLKSKVAVASGRPVTRARESILVCSICRRDDFTTRASRGCADVALCTELCRSSTEIGATCFFFCIISKFLVVRPLLLPVLLPESRQVGLPRPWTKPDRRRHSATPTGRARALNLN